MIEPNNYIREDMFTADEEGWITLPGEEGTVSPDGTVYDKDGEPMYQLFEDSETPFSIYMEDEDEYEWQ